MSKCHIISVASTRVTVCIPITVLINVALKRVHPLLLLIFHKICTSLYQTRSIDPKNKLEPAPGPARSTTLEKSWDVFKNTGN